MDWMERWFGLSPDNGDGSFEAVVLVALIGVALFMLLSRSHATRVRVRSALASAVAALERFSGRRR